MIHAYNLANREETDEGNSNIFCSTKSVFHSIQSYFLDYMTKAWPSLMSSISVIYSRCVFCLSLAILLQCRFSPRWKAYVLSHLFTYRWNMKMMVMVIISPICESLITSYNLEHSVSLMSYYAEVQKNSIHVSSRSVWV